MNYSFYDFPEYLVLWARYSGKFRRNHGGEAMNRAKSQACPAIASGDGGSSGPG